MTWQNNLSRIRRFLRDPDANIWSDTVVRNLFNDAQRDLQQKTGFLEDVQAVRVPPIYEFSYLQDFEWAFLTSTTGNYQALRFHQQAEIVFCHRWEPQAVWGAVEATAPDDGFHVTQPWEVWISGEAPGDIVPLQFPNGFHNAKFVAWDKQPIDFITLKGIQQDDPSWIGRMGIPFAYWRPDSAEDRFCLYPVPSSPVWDDITVADPDPVYVYTYSFEESEAYFSGLAVNWTREDTNYSRQYIFDWEESEDDAVDAAISRGMYQHERGVGSFATYGIGEVLYITGETASSEFGTVTDSENMVNTEYGITLDAIEADDNVLFVYSKTPTELSSLTDESDFPSYLQKYVEYGTLERAFQVDNDGQIQSLRDYWAMRKELGLKAIQRFMSLRKQDRDYRLTTKGAPGFRTHRQPRLPDNYPAAI